MQISVRGGGGQLDTMVRSVFRAIQSVLLVQVCFSSNVDENIHSNTNLISRLETFVHAEISVHKLLYHV